MHIKPKKHIADLYRVGNSGFDRSLYLSLDKNENIIGFSKEVLQDFYELISSDLICCYPDVSPLYEKLTEVLSLDHDQIYLSSGSDGAIKSIFEAYVEPGDEVFLVSPTYAMYYVYAQMFRARLKEFVYDNRLFVDPENIVKKISPATKLVCIPNPNSSTGTVFSQNDLSQIIEVAKENASLVLIDEAYQQFHGHTMMEFLQKYDNLLISRTFSKAMGLASCRLGFVVSSKAIVENLFKVRPLYEVNSFAVSFGCYLLNHPEIIKDYLKQVAEGKDYLEKRVVELGFRVEESHANFVLIHVGNKNRAEKIVDLLFEQKILIKGGFKENCLEPYIRVSLGSEAQMKIFVEKLSSVLDKISD